MLLMPYLKLIVDRKKHLKHLYHPPPAAVQGCLGVFQVFFLTASYSKKTFACQHCDDEMGVINGENQLTKIDA